MHIGNQAENTKYYMTEENVRMEITKVTEEKDLGVIIDNQLKFTKHINEKCKRKQIES